MAIILGAGGIAHRACLESQTSSPEEETTSHVAVADHHQRAARMLSTSALWPLHLLLFRQLCHLLWDGMYNAASSLSTRLR